MSKPGRRASKRVEGRTSWLLTRQQHAFAPLPSLRLPRHHVLEIRIRDEAVSGEHLGRRFVDKRRVGPDLVLVPVIDDVRGPELPVAAVEALDEDTVPRLQ